ncbi:hypothetical protein ACF0H5_020043 [Mactra antiquata]
MRALICAALVAISGHCALAFFPGFFPPSGVREASRNYYEVMTNCEREGGECVDVDFGFKTDAPSVPETETPRPTTTPRPTPRPTTRAPLPPPVATQNPFFFWFPFWNTPTAAPAFIPPGTRAPVPVLPPRVQTPAPTPGPAPRIVPMVPVRATTRAPQATTVAPKKPVKKVPRKGGRRGGRRRVRGGEEREVRRKRAVNPDPWDYLYNECSGGWEFDLGCSARGANVCCYSSSSNSPTK